MKITNIKYINLKKNSGRNKYMRRLLNLFAYNYQRIPGVLVTPDAIGLQKYLTKGIDPNLGSLRSNGVVGCWIAHCRALESIHDSEGITVILEDDFACTEDFFDSALAQIGEFNYKFDIILFDTYGRGPLAIHKVQEGAYKVTNRPDGFYGGTHCIFVRNESAPKILKKLLDSQVTDYDKFLLSNTDLSNYVFYSGKCSIRDFGSDITPTSTTLSSAKSSHRRTVKFPHVSTIYKKASEPPEEVRETSINTNFTSQIIGHYLVPGFEATHVEIKIKEQLLILRQEWDGTEIKFIQLSDGTFYNKEFSIPLEFSTDHPGLFVAKVHFYELYKKNENYLHSVVYPTPNMKIFEGVYSQDDIPVIKIERIKDFIKLNILSNGTSINFAHYKKFEFYSIGDNSFPIRFTTNQHDMIDNLIIFNRVILKRIIA